MQSNHLRHVKLYLALTGTVVAFFAGTVVWTVSETPIMGLALFVMASICLYLALVTGAQRAPTSDPS